MNKSIRNRLKSYGLLAGSALASATGVHADIMYTDVNPDSLMNSNGAIFEIDLGNEIYSYGDLQMKLVKWPGSYYDVIINADSGGGVATSYFVTGFSNWFMFKDFSVGESICGDNYFEESGFLGWYYYTAPSVPSNLARGKFNGVSDKCFGFKFWKSGHDHYGWVRLNVDTNFRSFTVMDYAYQSVSDSCIVCGAQPVEVDTARNLVMSNVPSSGNVSDIRISFDTAADQSGILEYHVFLVKESQASGIKIDDFFLPCSTCHQVFPTSGNVSNVALQTLERDVYGAYIVGGETYRFVVVSVPDPATTATNHKMTSVSNPITLGTFAAGTVTNLLGADVDNNCNGLDFQFSFNKAGNETGVVEYRVIVVKSSNAGTFTLADAVSVASDEYFGVLPGNNYILTLNAFSKDSDGDLIQTNVPYKFFVLSYANGTSTYSTMSAASNEVTLSPCTGIQEELAASKIYGMGKTLFIQSVANQLVVKVFDLEGKEVYSSRIDASKAQINLQHLPAGMYIATLGNSTGRISKKIIFEQ